MSERSVQHIAIQLFSALNHLHHNRMAHKDINLNNMMIHKMNVRGDRFLIKIKEGRTSGTNHDIDCPGRFRQREEDDIYKAALSLYTLLGGSTPRDNDGKVLQDKQ